MNILCVGDLHFKEKNLVQVDEICEKIVKAVKQVKPNIVVFLGDTLHNHEKFHVLPNNRAIKLFEEVSSITKTFLIIGNHDYMNNGQFLTENHPFVSIKMWSTDITVVDKVVEYSCEIDNEKYQYFFVPYVPPGRFEEALNTTKKDWKSANAIFAHQEFYGCSMESIISVKGDKWKSSYPPVISGHIHKSQILDTGVYYVGSASQETYAEDYDKRLWILKFYYDKDCARTFKYRKINLKMQRKRTLRFDNIEDVKNIKLEDYEEDDVKISITSTSEEFQAFKKTQDYKDISKKCLISHTLKESYVEDISKDVEDMDFKTILFTLIKNDEHRQKIFFEATGEKYVSPKTKLIFE